MRAYYVPPGIQRGTQQILYQSSQSLQSNETHRQVNKQLPTVAEEPGMVRDAFHPPPPRNPEQRTEIQSVSQEEKQMPLANVKLAITKVISTEEIPR